MAKYTGSRIEGGAPYVYISYSHHDEETADKIVRRMKRDGYRVWYAPQFIPADTDRVEMIANAIEESTVFMVLISNKGQDSKWRMYELEHAVNMRKKIIPVLLDAATTLSPEYKYMLRSYLWLDYSEGERFYLHLHRLLEETDIGETAQRASRRQANILRALFKARAEGKTVSLNEIKVVFLGDGEAGKSHTIARLLNNGGKPKDYTDRATPGIVIKNREYKVDGRKFQVHFWDFGGQEVLHSMHRIFLTERTLYVVLVNARDETQDARARYWLHNIQSFAPGAPVILVLNKMDQNPNASLNEADLRSKYPALKRIIKMSALKDSPAALNKNLRDPMLAEIIGSGILETQWRPSWIKVKQALEEMKEDFIDGTRYRQICQQCGVGPDQDEDLDEEERERKTQEEQTALLHWFNDLGVSFCCCDDYKLENYVILRPDWITNALYIILFNVCKGAKNGLLPHGGICRLLKPMPWSKGKIRSVLPGVTYDYNEVMYVLNVIRKFQLSFEGREDHEFIPMLCQRNAMPVAQEYAREPDTLEFVMEFEYLPNNVLHRLMVERQKELNMDQVWLTGALFQQKDTGLSAVVTIDGDKLRLLVRGSDPMHSPNTYLSMLKGNLDSIWRQMNLQKPDYKLVYRLDGERESFDYEMLVAMLSAGQQEVFSMTWKKMLPIWNILNQSAPAAADDSRKLLADLVAACQQLQANPDCWDLDENGRNTLVRNALRIGGYVVHDQTLQGLSGSGKSIGELDMDIRRYENVPWTICEALRVKDGSKADWNGHLAKLLDNYNPHGASFLYLLTYVDCGKEKFGSIWKGFEDHIKTCGTEKFEVEPDTYAHLADERWAENHYIQTARCRYACGSYTPTVYHIFVRLGK